MPTYVITGVSKGLGWEFLRQLSSNTNNLIVGVVRDKPTTEKRVAEELSGRSNIHILQADVTDYDALKRAAAETSTITGGAIDYIIANAGYISQWDAYDPIGVLSKDVKGLTEEFHKSFNINVLGQIYLFDAFVPLLLKGNVKKAIVLTSGHADLDIISDFEIWNAPLYSASKGAINVITAKYHAQYKKDGVLFLGISPGAVDTGANPNPTPEQLPGLMDMGGKFQKYAPHFTGPSSPETAIPDCINTWEKASLENGDGGAFISHKGDKQWL